MATATIGEAVAPVVKPKAFRPSNSRCELAASLERRPGSACIRSSAVSVAATTAGGREAVNI